MRVRAIVAVALAALALLGVAVAQASTRRAPARLLVTGDEFRLVLSRASVRRGEAVIQFLNRGEDPHDLRIERIGLGASRMVSAPEVGPGELVELETRLGTGRYRLWCSLPGHRELGMRAILRVRRR